MRGLDRKVLLDKKYKITESGTFTIDAMDVLQSENVKRLLEKLKPIPRDR